MMCLRFAPTNVYISKNIVSKYEFNNCQDLREYIKNLTEKVTSEKNRLLDDDQLEKISFVCEVLKEHGICPCDPSPGDLTVQVFRCLRNSCVHSKENQTRIARFSELYNFTVECFQFQVQNLISSKHENLAVSFEVIQALRCGLQFFGNLVVGNDMNKWIVWETFSTDSSKLFRCLLASTDDKIVDYAAMVLYNTLTEDSLKFLLNVEYFSATVNLIMKGFILKESHWCLLLIQKFLENNSFFFTYKELDSEKRIVILDVLSEELSQESSNVSDSFMEGLADVFSDIALDVVIAANSDENAKSSEIVRTLGALGNASVFPKFQKIFQIHARLLEVAIDVLKAVHTLGKTGSNVFSPVTTLKRQAEESLDVENSPAYGFKKDLIRLIGNISAGCQKAQDTVREHDGIPLLLDCCNIDAKNPFIMQWCTFAIRNILDNNPANQAVLAGITVTGELTDSPLLREMGFDVQRTEGGEFKLHKL